MKRIEVLLMSLLICMFALPTSVCAQSNSKLVSNVKEMIKETNRYLPMKVNEVNNVVWTHLSYDSNSNAVVYEYTVDTIADDINQLLPQLKEQMLAYMKSLLRSTSDPLMEATVKLGAKIVYKYKAKDGRRYSLEISNSELKSLYK